VQQPVIPIIGRWISETPGTISLGQGIVAYPPPAAAIEEAHRFGAHAGEHRYGPVEGLPELVSAIEQKLAIENGIRVAPESRVVVTAGANLAFMNAVLAIADPGDEVIVPAPYYFNHEMAVVMANARPVPVRTTPECELDLDAIRAAMTFRTRAVVTVSPNNPTGVVYSAASLRALNALCADRGVFHIHDEAYEYFTYDGATHFSPGSVAGAGAHTISIYSLSKSYGMASWRIGYMVLPESLWDAVNKIQDTLLICAPAVSQRAGVAALAVGRSYPLGQLGALSAMRQLVGDALDQPGVPWHVVASSGALYYFVRLRSTRDPLDVCERLIREHRVAVVPGSAFGDEACSIRVSFGALDGETAGEGVARLVRGLAALAEP
jgi:aspartate/methionine/tyrosine aminotransferase